MMKNSPVNASYLSGSNIGMVSFEINCTQGGENTWMGDSGSQFLSVSEEDDLEAQISIPTNVICQNQGMLFSHQFHESENRIIRLLKSSNYTSLVVVRLFYCIYRNTKLFVGNSDHPPNAWSQNNQLRQCSKKNSSLLNIIKLNSSNTSINQSSPSSSSIDSCTSGFWYSDNKVLTGTLINNGTPPYASGHQPQFIEKDGVRQNIVAVKYSKKKVRLE